jgi:hypothetical protein
MKCLVEKDIFNLMLKFIILKNQNPDASRCNIINVIVNEKEYQLTICCNEMKNQVVICEVADDLGNEIRNENTIECCFNELKNIVTNATTDDKNLKLYKFYKEKIEPVTECCELNQ